MKNPFAHLPKSPIYPEGYVSNVKEWPWGVEQVTIIPKGVHGSPEHCYLNVALNKDGHYIGSAEDANRLWDKYGIIPDAPGKNEDGTPKKTCSIGKGRDGKWYGWSHRAMYGFQIGDTMEHGCCGYQPSTVEEMYDSLYEWHGWEAEDEDPFVKNNLKIKVDQEGDQFNVEVSYDFTRNSDGEVLRSGNKYSTNIGKGTWTATTEEEAKEMARDFAESVSSAITDCSVMASSGTDPKILTKQEFLKSFNGFKYVKVIYD